MQIKVENISYNKLNDINFEIESGKITGIISNNIDDLNDINQLLYCGKDIKYMPKYNKKDIALVSIVEAFDIISLNVYDFIVSKVKEYKIKIENIDLKIEELFKKVDLNKSILNKEMNNLSTSEKIKVLLIRSLLYDPNTILLDNIFSSLDSKSRDKLFKVLINLKKFENKTIIISSIDIDIVYEFVDNIVIIKNGKTILCGDKFKCFEDEKIIENKFIDKPLVIEIASRVYKKSNIKLGKNDSINELIKSIYREVR